MHNVFLKEVKGQGAIEYILLAGGIIVSALFIFIIYSKMTGSASNKLNATTEAATSVISSKLNASLADL